MQINSSKSHQIPCTDITTVLPNSFPGCFHVEFRTYCTVSNLYPALGEDKIHTFVIALCLAGLGVAYFYKLAGNLDMVATDDSEFDIDPRVAKELKDINPQAFEQMMVYDYPTMNDVVRMTRSMGNSITNARTQNFSGGSFSPSRGGFGGFTSIGGGGGFSGGGFGGGSR